MTKAQFSPCDKLTYKVLSEYGCQTAIQIRTCMNRWYKDSYSAGSIAAALRKLAQKGMAACSENEKGQKVYWLTDFGVDMITQQKVQEEL